MIVSIVCSVILLQLLFLLAYRHPATFFVTFLPVAAGILTGFGVYGLLLTRVTPVIAASGAILAGLGVDYCIHSLAHYHAHRRRGGAPRDAARRMGAVGAALATAWVTSLIGFVAIAGSRIPGLRDFALIGGLGLAGAFVGARLLLPALLQKVDRGGRAERMGPRWHLAPLVAWASRARRGCLVTGAIAAAAGVAGLAATGLPGFESNMGVMQPRPNPPREARAQIGRQFPGAAESMQVHLEASSSRGLIRLAHDVAQRLEAPALRAHGVDGTVGVAALLPRPETAEARAARIRALDADRVVEEFRRALEQSLFDPEAYEPYVTRLRALLAKDEPPGLETLRALPQSAGTIVPRQAVEPPRARTIVQFDHRFESPQAQARAIAALEAALNPLEGVTVTGMEVVGQRIKGALQGELPLLLSLAGAVVIAWLMLVFRRPVWVALSVLPATFSLILVPLVMAGLQLKLNPINLLALPLLAGIGVDDGIFLTSIVARHRGRASRLIEKLASSCHAITMTSLTTLLAFGALLLTRTPAIQSLGLVLGIGMIVCWAVSLFLLTPLLLECQYRRQGFSS
jgi:predicted exporter